MKFSHLQCHSSTEVTQPGRSTWSLNPASFGSHWSTEIERSHSAFTCHIHKGHSLYSLTVQDFSPLLPDLSPTRSCQSTFNWWYRVFFLVFSMWKWIFLHCMHSMEELLAKCKISENLRFKCFLGGKKIIEEFEKTILLKADFTNTHRILQTLLNILA